MPDAVDVPRRIQDQYLTRLRALPQQTQRLMLVAAADPVGEPVLLQCAAHVLQLDIHAAEPAADAGLLDIAAAVRFRHPLLRSAVYRGADAQERRAVHAALADATDPQLDPDRRAWHRAYAAAAADEEVAAELIGSAARAASRGGTAAAAAFLERAVALTPDPGRRAERALLAAEAKYAAGDFVAVQKLLAAADVGPLDELGHAQVELMRARIAFKLNRGHDAPALLLHAAERLQPFDDDLTRQTLLKALVSAIYVGHLARAAGLAEVAQNAAAARLGPEPLPHPQLLLRGLAVRVLDGYTATAPLLKEALRQYLSEPSELDVLDHSYIFVATDLWDGDVCFEIAHRQMELARPTGTLASTLPRAALLRRVAARQRSWLRGRPPAEGRVRRVSAMGTKGFAERARRELEASGEKVHAARRDPDAELTPQERQIAHLARTRRTNAEIGAVFLSARTVGWHLRNIFTKLGIGSRHQLDGALRRPSDQMATSGP